MQRFKSSPDLAKILYAAYDSAEEPSAEYLIWKTDNAMPLMDDELSSWGR